jgi:UDP-N-acetylglucosamine acyltransferase
VDNIIPFEKHADGPRRIRSLPPTISSLASVDRNATIGDNVQIGPFCVVGPDAVIGEGTVLENSVTIRGRVTIGRNNRIFPGVVIGGEPQDVAYDGSPTEVIIGDRNTIRECVTINRATTKEDGVTTVGNDCFFMAGVHIAHDCRVGNHIRIANATLLGGHVHVHDYATISGNAGVHHFTRIGEYSFVTGVGRVIQDVPPYLLVEGNPSRPRCVNVVALKRNNFSRDVIRDISEAYRLLYRSRVGLATAREILRSNDQLCQQVNYMLDFIAYQQNGRHGRGREQIRRAA